MRRAGAPRHFPTGLRVVSVDREQAPAATALRHFRPGLAPAIAPASTTARALATAPASITGRASAIAPASTTARALATALASITGRALATDPASITGRALAIALASITGRASAIALASITGRALAIAPASTTGRALAIAPASTTGRASAIARHRQPRRRQPVDLVNRPVDPGYGVRPPAYNGWRGAYWGYHQGWANGYWHGYHNNNNWGWGSFALGAATGVTAWALGSSFYNWGYASYANPYYAAAVVAQPILIEQTVAGGEPQTVTVPAYTYDYSQPIDTQSAPPPRRSPTPPSQSSTRRVRPLAPATTPGHSSSPMRR